MGEDGIIRVGSHIWDDTNKKWIKDEGASGTGGAISGVVQISGVVPVDGKLPVDTEINLEGDVNIGAVDVNSAPLTEIFPSGVFEQLIRADDLIVKIQYNEPDDMTTISGILYSSSLLGTSALETFVSGVNHLTITRIIT